jgi:rod shape-determining protein MreC
MTPFRNKLAVSIIVLSVSFLILIGISVKRESASMVENGVGVTLNSVQGVTYKVFDSIKNSLGFVFNYSKVKQENENLRKENDDLQKKVLDYNAIVNQNERLSEMLNFKSQRSEYEYVGCNIIGKSGGNFLDGFTIDRGNKDGLEKGMVVITSRGLVGQVTSTASNWAIVQSISNENIAVSGMVESTSETSGIVRGYKDEDNRLLAKLYYLPLNSTVKEGDVILTSGYGNLYPKGIRIGKVIGVEEDMGKIMKNAVIEPYVDFNKLEEVFVVLPKDKRDIKY